MLRQLSDRQLEVLGLIALGLRYKEIAERLGLSERTISIHADMLRRNLGAVTLAHAVHLGWKLGLLTSEKLVDYSQLQGVITQ